MKRVLHLLSQRPLLTGSGITLDALVRHAAAAGWEQAIVFGGPREGVPRDLGGLDGTALKPLFFGGAEDALDFAVPGMSDVMPYESTRFSALNSAQVRAYHDAWRTHLAYVIAEFAPDLIHSHHLWLLSALVKDVAPGLPVVAHCHATGLRQMELCPHLAPQVIRGCRRIERFVLLHDDHRRRLERTLALSRERFQVVGAGYREELFYFRAGKRRPGRLLYIGKLSQAKGLPWLLDAFEQLLATGLPVELHVAGSGSGAEADDLRVRMEALGPRLTFHGQLAQQELAALMRSASVTVLPSFYEGLPLVLVEAYACGSRLVTTALPGIADRLAEALAPALEQVALPPMLTIDRPDPAGLPRFVDNLCEAIRRALDKPALGDPERCTPSALESFTWSAVFRRVEKAWLSARRAVKGTL